MAAEYLNAFFFGNDVCFRYKRVGFRRVSYLCTAAVLIWMAHCKEHNVELASVYIECCMQVHDMSRPSLLRVRSTHLFAQMLPYKGLT